FAWNVPIERIKEANYNLDSKNPNAPTDDHGDPDELLAMHQKLLTELSETLNALKTALMSSLGGRKAGGHSGWRWKRSLKSSDVWLKPQPECRCFPNWFCN